MMGKHRILLLCWSVLLLCYSNLEGLNPVSLLQKTPEVVQPLQRWEKRVQTLRTEREGYSKKLEEVVRSLISGVANKIAMLKRTPDRNERIQQFLSKKLSLLSRQHTVLIEWEGSIQKILGTIDQLVTLLQEQESNESQQAEKAVYSFEDVLGAEQKVVETNTHLVETENQRLLMSDDVMQRKKALAVADEEYEAKRIEKEQFSTVVSTSVVSDGLSPAQQGELLDLEERLAWYKKELAGSKVQEAEYAVEHTDIQIAHDKAQLAAFKKTFSRIKKSARVTADYVETVEKALDQKRQATVVVRERLHEKLRGISELESKLQRDIKEEQERLNISVADLAHIRALDFEPKRVSEWQAYAILLGKLIDESLYRIEHEYIEAEVEVEKAQFRRDELEASIIRSWHRMTAREARFVSDEDVAQESNVYTVARAELENQLAALTRGRDAAIASLHQLNISFDKLRSVAENLARHQRTLFRDHLSEYYEVVHLFELVEEKVRRRFDYVSRLIEAYATAISVIQGNLKKVEGVVKELTAKSFWRRSELSLSWSDVRGFIPDLSLFLKDFFHGVGTFFTYERVGYFIQHVKYFADEPLRLLLVLINIILVIAFYFLLSLYLPDVILYIGSIGQGYTFIHALAAIAAGLLSFMYQHITTLYVWALLFVLIRMHLIVDILFAQLFYIASIPYGLWLVYQIVLSWKEINRERRHLIVQEAYERRFFGIISLMLSVAVTALCIREAFLLGNYSHSQVPTVLLAMVFILGQISLIGLLGRTQILGMLRSDTPLWQWIYDHVNRYYYIVWCIFIAIIVMSNPYVGYGRQVFYIIIRLLLTAALIPLFSWIHSNVKHISLDLFFYYSEREVIKERFITGRFWYSMFVISSLIIFLAAGIFFGAKLWGFSLTLRDMTGWLRYPLYTSFDEAGREISITAVSFLYVILYFIGGMIVAYLINTFVISRVLDPVIVESGVQNTVLTLMRYLIISCAVIMGLTSVGLEAFTTKFIIILAGIGFAVQEAIRDLISYFILLVQRPVKVGDFIRVLDNLSTDDDVALIGVVRSITPRSIVIRKRNSTTLIVPNSRVVMNPIMNWTYSRGFFAFDDMRVTVPYGVDPIAVRQLMLDVLDKNPHVLKNPTPIVRLADFVDNGYSFLLRAFLTSNKVAEQWDITSEIRLTIVKTLREKGIEIASPVRTIRLASPKQQFFARVEAEVDQEDESA